MRHSPDRSRHPGPHRRPARTLTRPARPPPSGRDPPTRPAAVTGRLASRGASIGGRGPLGSSCRAAEVERAARVGGLPTFPGWSPAAWRLVAPSPWAGAAGLVVCGWPTRVVSAPRPGLPTCRWLAIGRVASRRAFHCRRGPLGSSCAGGRLVWPSRFGRVCRRVGGWPSAAWRLVAPSTVGGGRWARRVRVADSCGLRASAGSADVSGGVPSGRHRARPVGPARPVAVSPSGGGAGRPWSVPVPSAQPPVAFVEGGSSSPGRLRTASVHL